MDEDYIEVFEQVTIEIPNSLSAGKAITFIEDCFESLRDEAVRNFLHMREDPSLEQIKNESSRELDYE